MLFLFFLFFFFLLFEGKAVFASDITQMVSILSKIAGADFSIEKSNLNQLDELQTLSHGLIGTHSYGNLYYDNTAYNWGNGTDTWQQILSLYKNGARDGKLFSLMQQVENEFPINSHFESPNPIENDYYRLQAQTTLASRASSQLAFEQAAREARTLAQLHTEIDKAKDSKSAIDLNNRLASEQANLTLQQTKLLALLVQQVATDAQEKANRANEDAHFFNY
ncbi:MAG: Legionella vir ue protein [Gammaproteobacteria bacterium]|nr:Legionella vir ue protein [Gammaproteobacteria bacterium]